MARNISPVVKAYSALLNRILSGKLKSGEKLREEKLCRELDVSRTPLREALVRLAQDGLVEKVPRYGCQVRTFSPVEIKELFECRTILEAAALLQAKAFITDSGIDAVFAAIKAVDNSEDERSASVNADMAMHNFILEFCPNSQLVELIKSLQLRTAAYRNYRAYKIDDLAMTNRERYDIMTAVKNMDYDKAVTLLGEHIMHGADMIAGN